MVLVHDVDLHFAEAAGEGHLARRRHVLRRKQQHLVAQERLVDRVEELVAHVVGELDVRIAAPSFGVSGRSASVSEISMVEFIADTLAQCAHGGQM